MKKTRRILSLSLVLIMLISLLTACAGTPADSPSPDGSTPSATTDTPSATTDTPSATSDMPPASPPTNEDIKYKEEITVIFDNTMTTVNRFNPGTDTLSVQRLYLCILERLLDRADGEIVPLLATDWHTDDYKVFTLNLRDDVYFHNGEQFTADDVVFTFKKASETPGSYAYDYIGKFIEDAEAVSDFEVEITLNAVNSDFTYNLTLPCASISNREAAEADSENGFAVGTGPWVLDNFVTGEYVTMVRNEDYRGEIPVTKKLTFRYVAEEASRMLMLETGEAQAAIGTNWAVDYPVLEYDDRFTAFENITINPAYVSFNMNDPITGDINFRMAVASVLDRQKHVTVSVGGYGLAYDTDGSFWPFETDYRNTDIPLIPYDIEKAKEYLELSSYNGEEVSITCAMPNTILDAQLLQEALVGIGVNAVVNQTDGPGLMQISKTTDNKSQILIHMINMPAGPASIRAVYYPGSTSNRASWNNERVKELLDLVVAETDEAERERMYKEIQAIAAEELPVTALYCVRILFGALKGVGGIEMSPEGYHRLAYIYMIEE